MAWHDLYWLLVIILLVAGLAGSILPVLPGPVLVFAGLLLAAWLDGFVHVGRNSLLLFAVLTLLAHAVDFIAGVYGAKVTGAGRGAIIGAAIGTLVGLFFGLPGLLLGPILGAGIGELININNLPHATRAGIGAGLGVVAGMLVKFGICVLMVVWFLWLRVF